MVMVGVNFPPFDYINCLVKTYPQKRQITAALLQTRLKMAEKRYKIGKLPKIRGKSNKNNDHTEIIVFIIIINRNQ